MPSCSFGAFLLCRSTVNRELNESDRRVMIETGKAFYTIREKRLFRQEFTSFEDYVRERWKVPVEYAELAIDLYLAHRN